MSELVRILAYPKAPPQFKNVITQLYDVLSAHEDIAVLAGGSLRTGKVDRFSDVDLVILVDNDERKRAIATLLSETLPSLGQVLARFPATHLGLPDLKVTFLQVDGWVVKVDTLVAKTGEAEAKDDIVLHDPKDLSAHATAVEVADPDTEVFSDLDNKFTGWCWYTYSKIARGEYFEAAANLGEIRELAILPGLLFVYGLPTERGYRYLEESVEQHDCNALADTYARGLEREELIRALLASIDVFTRLRPRIAAKLGAEYPQADLERMRKLILEAELGHLPTNR